MRRPDVASTAYTFVATTCFLADSRLAAAVMKDQTWSTGVADALLQRDAWHLVLATLDGAGMRPREGDR